ncbi:MAG: flagellar biosynthesis anti-sigma factor FlgM [Actinobacteria bacterium]|nr:flagellar biosynthesis anti-sigma factor FlgM [Actinomycetota bacterium]
MRAELEELKRRIESGEYDVDPQAIAGAILRRRGSGQSVSDVLVPAQVDRGAIPPDQAEPPARRDLP